MHFKKGYRLSDNAIKRYRGKNHTNFNLLLYIVVESEGGARAAADARSSRFQRISPFRWCLNPNHGRVSTPPLVNLDALNSLIRLSDEIMPSPADGRPFASQGG